MRKLGNVQRQGSVSVAVGATQNILSYTVPHRATFKLTAIGTYASAQAAFGNLTWVFKVNGNPIFPYNSVQDQLGSQQTPFNIYQEIYAHGGDLFTVDCTNSASAPQAFSGGALIQGELWI